MIGYDLNCCTSVRILSHRPAWRRVINYDANAPMYETGLTALKKKFVVAVKTRRMQVFTDSIGYPNINLDEKTASAEC